MAKEYCYICRGPLGFTCRLEKGNGTRKVCLDCGEHYLNGEEPVVERMAALYELAYRRGQEA